MSMGWKGIERNKLDYILTDLLPVELSELFSFRPFYDFLLQGDNQKTLSEITENLKAETAKSNQKLFVSNWASEPLKYSILKNNGLYREMSLIQPIAALNIYLFMECYQKDILIFLSNNHYYSIRYHKKSSELYYKSRSKKETVYFSKEIIEYTGKSAIQQTGSYFKINPFESINSFSESRIWRLCNFKYQEYAKIDYKSCFDSIYSHAYKWIIERNTNDSKDSNNSNLFITIDRIIQNINGRKSNGLVVGPEFSRLIAEILLQEIDKEVHNQLIEKDIRLKDNYQIFRYVDDIFIFADSADTLKKVIEEFRLVSNKYRLTLNELKFEQGNTPCVPKEWIAKTRVLSDSIDDIFNKHQDSYNKDVTGNDFYVVKKNFISVDRIKDEFTILVKSYATDVRTIVSFCLSVLLNNLKKKNQGDRLFAEGKTNKALLLVDLAMFIYAFSPTFDSTRKIISMIVYMDSEIKFSLYQNKANEDLQNIINRYNFVFKNGNLCDLCDWLPFLTQYHLHLDAATENALIYKAKNENNPIIWANLLLYSKYNESFFNEMALNVNQIVLENLRNISGDDIMMCAEFWYILVFNNSPFLTDEAKNQIKNFVDDDRDKFSSKDPTDKYSSTKIRKLIYRFISINNDSNQSKPSFFNWSENSHIAEQITYRTYKRTIFKKYHRYKNSLYVSLD
jgi:hypothetical protein